MLRTLGTALGGKFFGMQFAISKEASDSSGASFDPLRTRELNLLSYFGAGHDFVTIVFAFLFVFCRGGVKFNLWPGDPHCLPS